MLLENSTKENKNQNENVENIINREKIKRQDIEKARYTTADFKSKEFNKDWLGIESDTSSIDLNSLLEDVSFIANYLNEFELE